MYRKAIILAAAAATLAAAGCERKDSAAEAPRIDPASFTAGSLARLEWPGAAQGAAGPEAHLTRRNFMVVYDMSGSMGWTGCTGAYRTRAEAAREALSQWIAAVSDDDNVGLIIFDGEGTSVRLPLGPKNGPAFMRAVDASTPAGGTPLYDAVHLAYEEISRQAARQRGFGEYRIVTVTDGEHSRGQNPAPVIDRIAGDPANPVELHTVGFCIERSALNQPGRTFYHAADDPESLAEGLVQALAEADASDSHLTYFDYAQEQ